MAERKRNLSFGMHIALNPVPRTDKPGYSQNDKVISQEYPCKQTAATSPKDTGYGITMDMYINQKNIKGWETKGCGIACVSMILAETGKESDTGKVAAELIHMNGYLEGIGWKHAALARTLNNRKVPSYNQEFTCPGNDPALRKIGMEKIREETDNGNLIIASVLRGFDSNATATHLVLITKTENAALIVNDPDYETGKENMPVSCEKFEKVWRGYAVFAELKRIRT